MNAQKGCASIRGPDDVKNEIGACLYWKRASNGEFRVIKVRCLSTDTATLIFALFVLLQTGSVDLLSNTIPNHFPAKIEKK